LCRCAATHVFNRDSRRGGVNSINSTSNAINSTAMRSTPVCTDAVAKELLVDDKANNEHRLEKRRQIEQS
jgi:hypothetical protein